jgi:hypothetical protein
MPRSSVTRYRVRSASVGLVLVVAGLLVATVRAERATADTVGTVFGPKCPDVMVIAARGSGEEPQQYWTDPTAYQDTNTSLGAGKVNLDLFRKLEDAAPRLRFSIDPVQYPAINAWNAWDTWRNASYFDSSINSGATTVLADIERTERNCGGGVKYLFTGYSQGAWVVHRALWRLASSNSKQLLGKIVGVAMFGDPKFTPHDEIVRDNKLLLPYYGVLTGGGIDLRDTYVPKNLRQLTASYCFTTDPICQGPPNPLWAGEMGACAVSPACKHYRYIEEGKTAKAATFLTPKLPPKSFWPRLTGSKPPAGTVGATYEWTASVVPAAGIKYIWTALTAPPPGLQFSESGVLSGTPTSAGTYAFRIKAQSDPQERYATGTVTVTIHPQGSATACSSGTCTAVGWGANDSGQVGDGTTTNAPTAMPVNGLTGVTAVAAGGLHSLALRSDRTVWAWGWNGEGQLGDGTTTQRSTPVQVNGLTGVTAVAAGSDHSLALRNDGTVWAWGSNSSGKLGDGTTTNASTPIQVSGLSGVTAIAAGSSHSLAVRGDGTVWAWGEGQWDQLGSETTHQSSTPLQVSSLTGMTAIAAGEYHNLAIRDDGTVWAWGGGWWGQLGDGTTVQTFTPVQVSGLSGATAVAAAGNHSLAVHS